MKREGGEVVVGRQVRMPGTHPPGLSIACTCPPRPVRATITRVLCSHAVSFTHAMAVLSTQALTDARGEMHTLTDIRAVTMLVLMTIAMNVMTMATVSR